MTEPTEQPETSEQAEPELTEVQLRLPVATWETLAKTAAGREISIDELVTEFAVRGLEWAELGKKMIKVSDLYDAIRELAAAKAEEVDR